MFRRFCWPKTANGWQQINFKVRNIIPSAILRGMASHQLDLNGIFAAVPTPFETNPQQTVHYEMFRQNIRKWEQIPLKGYCIGGSNGEGPCLKPNERLSMIEIMKSEIAKNKLIIAGATGATTNETIELSKAAAVAGADAVMIFTPFYFRARLTDTNIIDYFVSVADAISIPVIIYNNPYTTGIDLSLSVIKILSTHQNICGIKDCELGKLGCIVQSTRDSDFKVMAASAKVLLPALQMGCKGGIMGLPTILGKELCQLQDFVQNENWKEAIELQKRLVLVDSTIITNYGPPGLKAAMDLKGYFGGDCRRPLSAVNELAKQKIKEVLTTQQFIKNMTPTDK